MPITVKCSTCGKDIQRRPSQIHKSGHYFCTRKCIVEWKLKNWHKENSPAWRGGPVEVICDACGKTIERSPAQIKKVEHHFCNRACRKNWLSIHGKELNQHLKKTVVIPCSNCGKPVERTPSTKNPYKETFCNRQCIGEWRSKNWQGKNCPNWKETPPLFCSYCGSQLDKKLNRGLDHEHHFCDRDCYSKWVSKNKIGDKAPQWKGGNKKVACAFCGKEIERIRSEVEHRSVNFFCSIECHGKWRSQNIVGEKHPGWKGGYQPYYGPNWETQRRAARKRDGNKCRKCGKTEVACRRKLDVHHIKSFHEFGYVPGENENYKQANRLSNLISLCENCHKEIEFRPELMQAL